MRLVESPVIGGKGTRQSHLTQGCHKIGTPEEEENVVELQEDEVLVVGRFATVESEKALRILALFRHLRGGVVLKPYQKLNYISHLISLHLYGYYTGSYCSIFFVGARKNRKNPTSTYVRSIKAGKTKIICAGLIFDMIAIHQCVSTAERDIGDVSIYYTHNQFYSISFYRRTTLVYLYVSPDFPQMLQKKKKMIF